MSVRLTDIASIIRSKNAGPYELTLDILFKDRESFERVTQAGVINRALIAKLYGIPEVDITNLVAFAPANAIKITFKRPLVSGSVGETDVYGAQQHAPLLSLTVPIAE